MRLKKTQIKVIIHMMKRSQPNSLVPTISQYLKVVNSRPVDVFKLFENECCYSGGPTEANIRPYRIFFNACQLCGVDELFKEIMFTLIQTTFLEGTAMLHFTNVIMMHATALNGVIKRIEDYFQNERAKRVNKDV